MNPKSPKNIQSVQRAIDIIACFKNGSTEMSLAEISSLLHLNKSTVHGLLNTLRQNEYVEQDISGKYKLGHFFRDKIIVMNDSKQRILKEKAKKAMQELSNRYNCSTAIFTLESGELILLERIHPNSSIYSIAAMETIINPLHTSASGKLLLATFDEEQLDRYLRRHPLLSTTSHSITTKKALRENIELIRRNRYSIEDEELELGVYAVSAPIVDDKKCLYATISATGLSVLIKNNIDLVRELKTLADNFSDMLFNHK